MRLYKLIDEAEFPEKTETGYVNIRSVERVDVRPNETRSVYTGLRITKTIKEDIIVKSAWDDLYLIEESGEELYIKVFNMGERNIMIYPGMVIGEIFSRKI